MKVVKEFEKKQMKADLPDFGPGDTIRVHLKVVEGERERVQMFQGTVIGRTKGGSRERFTVRQISHGVGVERIFLTHSPRVEKIEVVRRGKTRRAKLYYLRERVGREARIEEQR